jgi:acylphosphatase
MSNRAGERRTLHFTGHVQGVGFRYTAANIAQRFAVTGFVQNLPDGRVLLVVEGVASELTTFVAELETQQANHIRHVGRDIGPATGEFATFAIRH